MTIGRWSVPAALVAAGLTSLALTSAAGASHSVTDLASAGPAGGNGAFDARSKGISQDGTHVFFHTAERLVSADTDACQDVYERVGWTTTLVSPGPSGGSGAGISCSAEFNATSQDGTRVFFTTQEGLGSPDSDSAYDVYERSEGTTTLVSQGTSSSFLMHNSFFIAASEDGGRVFFRTSGPIEPGDLDSQEDIYERRAGTTTRVSTGPTGGNGSFAPTFGAISADGTRAFFATEESLVEADTDTYQDVYERAGDTTTLVSSGPNGGNGGFHATFNDTSHDGTRVLFRTAESLVPEDVDVQEDIYERAAGTTTLVSTGPTGGGATSTYGVESADISADGTRAFFSTSESLVSADTDSTSDIYERAGDTTTLVSSGPAGGNGAFTPHLSSVSRDGTRVFFKTDESLVSADTDSTADIYERAGDTTTLVSTGPIGGNGTANAFFAAASADGSRVFFSTAEALVSNDTDAGGLDIYERAGDATTLVSTGPVDPQGIAVLNFERISADGTRAVFRTGGRLVSADTDAYEDVYVASAGVTTGFARPKGATPLFVPLVPVYEQCANGNTTHGAPFVFESCNPPVLSSRYLTVGTPDANGKAAKSIGSLKLKVIAGNPSTTADEADISIAISLTDVRNQSDLSDYTGELLVTTSLRITDKLNGGSQTLPGTVADMPLGFAVSCAATGDTAIGGACTLNTTLDGLVAGAVKESKHSIYKVLGDVDVYDGGADGDGETVGGNTLFAGTGLFVP